MQTRSTGKNSLGLPARKPKSRTTDPRTTAVSSCSRPTCAGSSWRGFTSGGVLKRSVAPAHCSDPGPRCAGAKSGHRGVKNVQSCGERREFKAANKSGAENAIITAKRLEPLKGSIVLYTGTVGKGSLRAGPTHWRVCLGDVHSFERREPKLRILLKRLPASGGQAASIFSWPLKWAASSTCYWFCIHERYKIEGGMGARAKVTESQSGRPRWGRIEVPKRRPGEATVQTHKDTPGLRGVSIMGCLLLRKKQKLQAWNRAGQMGNFWHCRGQTWKDRATQVLESTLFPESGKPDEITQNSPQELGWFSWVSVLLWFTFSLLCPHPTSLKWECFLCVIVGGKSAIYVLIAQRPTVKKRFPWVSRKNRLETFEQYWY